MDSRRIAAISLLVCLVALAGCSGTTFEEGLTTSDSTDPDGDGRYSTFEITVRADTTDINQYRANIWVNGEWNGQTVVQQGGNRTVFTINFNESHLSSFEQGDLNVTIALADPNTNKSIKSWSITVPYEGATATATPTPGPAAPTGTGPTPTPTATATATPTPTPTPDPDQTAWTVAVIDIVDGDTMDIRFANGTSDTIRLLGVDTPETSVGSTDPAEWEGIPDTDGGRAHLAEWGDEATNYAELQLGDTIYIELDETADTRGSYGRLLVYVYATKDAPTSFNERLLENGYARLYESEFIKRSSFEDAEATAMDTNTGVWDYESPSTSGSASLEITTIHEDASGNDYDNLNDEYVTIENTGSSLNMDRYTLEDEANQIYTFGDFTLGAGDSVTIYTGSGSDSGTALYWGQDAPVWNNGGDTVTIRDASGSVVVEREYD